MIVSTHTAASDDSKWTRCRRRRALAALCKEGEEPTCLTLLLPGQPAQSGALGAGW
jgi:hypothetical protein